jgi:hypothetical protein
MNVGNRPEVALGRGLYMEIAQIEEQHVTLRRARQKLKSLKSPPTTAIRKRSIPAGPRAIR